MVKTTGPGANSGQDGKTNTSLGRDDETLRALKNRAIEEESSVQKIVETLIEDYLNSEPKPRS